MTLDQDPKEYLHRQEVKVSIMNLCSHDCFGCSLLCLSVSTDHIYQSGQYTNHSHKIKKIPAVIFSKSSLLRNLMSTFRLASFLIIS